MENLEKVELIREKCGVTYEVAKDALEACDYDVLEAIIAIEKAEIEKRAAEIEDVIEEPAKAEEPEAEAQEPEAKAEEPKDAEAEAEAEATAAEPEDADAYEVADEPKAEENTDNAGRRSANVAAAWNRFCGRCKDLTRASLDMTFVAERHGEKVIAIPVLFVIIGLLVWGAALWLLIIGLFFGFRYRIEGRGMMVSGINEVMGKAADAADDVKQNLA